MKKINKAILGCILSVVIFISIPVGKIIFEGYSNYKEELNYISIDNKINQIKKDKDYTKLEDIDQDFLDAIVSVEDHRFYDHKAVDFIALTRATLNNIKTGKIVQGGSTITQQLAKNLYLNGDRNFTRKISELFIANDLEKKYSKDEILELYVNVINYGNGYTGIKEASEGYYKESPDNLDLQEASMLAGLPQCPNGYNPNKYLDKAIARQQQVLAAIDKYSGGYEITQDYILALGHVESYRI